MCGGLGWGNLLVMTSWYFFDIHQKTYQTHNTFGKCKDQNKKERCYKTKTCGKHKSYKGVRVDMRQEVVANTDGKTYQANRQRRES